MSPHKSKEKSGCMNYFGRFTISVVTYTELFFYKLGLFVGKHPFRTIALCWLLVILSAFGFLRFREEKDPLKLWIPPHTTFARDTQWLMTTLHQAYRDESVLITAEDVLTPEVFQQLYDIDVQVRNARSSMNLTLQDVCFEIPKLDKGLLRMLEDNTTKVDPSTTMNAALYCSFVESMKKECYVKSALELWNFNKKKIYNLTKAEIINKINTYDKNYVFGKLKNYEDLLGGVVRNESGHIVQATAILNYWYVLVNFSSTDVGKTGNHAGTAVAASEEALDWEYIFLEIMKNASSVYNNMYYKSMRSFGDITNDVLFQDIYLLICGVGIMVIYVQLVISKYNFLEARAVLGCIGLLTIGMSFVVGSGLCALCGVSYGPVHTSLPFLLMGLGVDDMFVILACWEELTSEQKSLPLHEQIGLMLKHAGVSITITSLTDVIAFLIGASTILPCLESFCIYAAAGVLMTFIFAVTFFIACFVIDQRRLDQKRNGIIPCIVHENYVPNECSQRKISNSIFKFIYSKIILSIPGKIIVIVISIVTVGFAVESALKLEQHFNPEWFLTPESHLAVYLKNIDFYYPDNGYDAGFYMGSINYSEEITKIHKAVIKLENLNCTKDVVSWVAPFREYVMNNFQHDIFEMPLDDDRFRLFLSKFLHSSRNAKYQAYFVFDGELQCGAPTPKIKMSYVDFYFKRYKDPRDQIFPMHQVRDIAEQINFTTGDKFATSWSIYFSTWITDELIEIEVMRNLQLALLCVMLCTIILIADWQTCFWIFVMVLLTMIEVCGFMQRWGLTIDLVACIGLELAIGLCVDYSTHVGHTFLTIPNGTKQDRIIKTVTSIGAAVLYGGLSTFIGVFMLSQSSAYTFQALFKIFALVILFGLYNGIVLLPVILSLVGPQPYRVHKPVPMTELDMK